MPRGDGDVHVAAEGVAVGAGHSWMTGVDCLRQRCLGSRRRIQEFLFLGAFQLVTSQSSDRPSGPDDLSVPPAGSGMREALHVKLSKRSGAFVATGLAAAMMLSACGGSDDNGDSGTPAASGGTFSVQIGEPENPL